MKHLKKLLFAVVAVSIILVAGLYSTTDVQAATTKYDLATKIKKQSGQSLKNTYYTDFDGNGSKELFAVTNNDQIWFASSKQVKKVFNGSGYCYCTDKDGIKTVSSTQKLFIMETGAYGSSSQSQCYYVANGYVKTVSQSNLEFLKQVSGKVFATYPSAYDNMYDRSMGFKIGHTYKRYLIKWNGSKFIDYTCSSITTSTLKSYSNGANVLAQIKKQGYTVNKIYKRSNGIININVSKSTSDYIMYENVTLKLKDGHVSLVSVDPNYGSNIIQKSSYGGIYTSYLFK